MADEITVNYRISVINGTFRDTFQPPQQKITQSAIGLASGVAAVGTTEEAVPIGDLSTEGIAVVQNLDATNFITIGSYVAATYYPVIKVKPGEIMHYRFDPTVTHYWKADTASCNVQYRIYEN